MDIRLNQPYSFTQLGQRGNQEDARFPDCDEPVAPQPFFVVCDGVGGSEKGEVASRTVCDAFGKALETTDWTREFTIRDFERALDYAFRALESVSNEKNKGMATTLTFAAFHSGGCFIAHIGDSRVYYVRPGEGIVYRTEDHSLVNALVKAGCITPEEALAHPDRNVITRAVCVPEKDRERAAATTVNIADVRPGDSLLLCSDGVLKMLDDGRIAEILSGGASDREKCAQIAEMSCGSDDNNTAYVVSVKEVAGNVPVVSVIDETESESRHPEVKTQETAVKYPSKRKKNPVSAIITVMVALAVAALGYFIFKAGFADDSESVRKTESGQPENAGRDGRLLEDIGGLFDAGDEDAQFPGGDAAMREFVAKHLKYPADALKQKKEGTVLVRFKVTADGNVENVKIEKGVFPSLDKEALRICSLLPAFKPAVAGGKPESSVFVMPVEFRLPQEKTDAAPVRKKETKAPRADDGVPKEGGESKPGATSVQPQDVPDNAPVIAV